MAETSYAKCGDLSLAYQVLGDGPVELVFVGPMVTHIDLFWTMPEFKAFFEQLATFCRVLLFDKLPKVITSWGYSTDGLSDHHRQNQIACLAAFVH